MNCHNCLLCDNLENKNYCIENKEYSREEFAMLKAEMLRNKNIFSHYANTVATVGNNHGSSDIINGNFVLNSQQVENGKYCFYLKNARNVIVVGSPHENVEIYDTFEAGSMGNSHFY